MAIIIDHLAYFPNGLDWWSGRGNLYVSAAEGFFLISGIVLGIVRGRKLINQPFMLSAKLLLKRSLQLYITAIILMLIFTFAGWLFIDNPGLKPGIRPITENIWEVIWGGLTFNYIYGWADYLRLYAIFIAASPLAIWLLRKKLWYVVLAISILVWTQFQNSPLETPELSQVYSWQLIFFSGLIIGFHFNTIRNWWSNLAANLRTIVITTTVSIAAATMVANFIIVYAPELIGDISGFFERANLALAPHFVKEELSVARLILFAIWFGASFWFFNRFETYIVRYLGWLLMPFGTNSLYVYTLQAFLVFFAHFVLYDETPYLLLNLLLTIAGVLVIWLAVKYKFLMKIIPR